MNRNRLRCAIIPVVTTITLLVCGCAPGSGGDAADVAAVAEPEAPAQKFVSAMTVTSNCGVEYIPVAVPGFAEPAGVPVKDMPPPIAKMQAVGEGRALVATDTARVSPGYILIEPMSVKQSFLINNDKEVIATLEGDYFGIYTQLLPNGNRLVEGQIRSDVFEDGGGKNGCLEELTPEGELLWRINMSSDKYVQHHDSLKLPNGNILALVWEEASVDEAVSQGRDPDVVAESGTIWFDGVIEVNPYTLEIVWEWSIRHHLVQDFDLGKSNYGVVADHPERLDINKVTLFPGEENVGPDWTHLNALDYNPELDQIALSSNFLSEIWIIDHSTTPRESAGHSGGRYGKGGDFLYRWGNPENYRRGTEADRLLFNQHDVQWILPGLPGAGNMMIYNNGDGRLRPHTTVVEFTPAMNADGSYDLADGATYGPETLAWEYDPDPSEQFLSWFISGAQRQPNGNTLINHGAGGHVREVTTDGEIVWDYSYEDDLVGPQMLFRVYRYPADHPALAHLLPATE